MDRGGNVQPKVLSRKKQKRTEPASTTQPQNANNTNGKNTNALFVPKKKEKTGEKTGQKQKQ